MKSFDFEDKIAQIARKYGFMVVRKIDCVHYRLPAGDGFNAHFLKCWRDFGDVDPVSTFTPINLQFTPSGGSTLDFCELVPGTWKRIQKFDGATATTEEIDRLFSMAKAWSERLESEYRKNLVNSLIDG